MDMGLWRRALKLDVDENAISDFERFKLQMMRSKVVRWWGSQREQLLRRELEARFAHLVD